MTRRIQMLAALLAGALFVGGCGGGHSSTRTSTPTPAAGGTGAPKQLTKAQASAFARAVNLLAADVPGFGATKHERESPNEEQLGRKLVACAGGASKEHQILELKSPEFQRGSGFPTKQVQSGVTVEQSRAFAQQDLAAIKSARGSACFSRLLDAYFRGKNFEGAHVGRAAVTVATPPAQGTDGAFALRIVLPIEARGVKIPIYFDFLGFTLGPAEISLLSTGAPDPFPAATQQRLFTLLLTRARAHGV